MPDPATGPGSPSRSSLLRRLPIPLPVAAGLAAVLIVVIAAGILLAGSGSDPASETVERAASSTTPRPSAPPATAAPTAPLPTRSTAEENLSRRVAFIDTMKRMGLTPSQADCAADRVQSTIGWSQLSESLMDPGKPDQLEDVLVACVKG